MLSHAHLDAFGKRHVGQVTCGCGERPANPNGGDGWVRIIGFNREIDKVIVRTYSPTVGSYHKDEDNDIRLPYPVPLL